MIKNEYNVVGVMSGTSLDGIDIAHVYFLNVDGRWSFKILKSETIPYSNSWFNKLSKLTDLSREDILNIDIPYTLLLADTIKNFIDNNKIKNLDAICSHGHTALHNPDEGYTMQIGNRELLFQVLKTTVVCNFRVQDVALGGQGAPLVPIGDKLLFFDYNHCLNLGGFANISTNRLGKRIAYDICPVNIVLNYYTRKIGLDYDEDGIIASQGTINTALLDHLNNLAFYKATAPKSLGLEWVENQIFPLIDSYGLETKDILRTFIEHIAQQIAIHLKNNATVLITGGGAYNIFLIERLKVISKSKIIIPDNTLIEYKEALIFGLLGVLKLRGEINCLKSVTGASKDHSSGIVFNN